MNYQNRRVFITRDIDTTLLLSSNDENDLCVYDGKPTDVALNYLWGQGADPLCTVISGGNNTCRVAAMMPFVRKAQNGAIPIIALHCGNQELENLLARESSNTEFIGDGRVYYDVFRGLPVEDIAGILYDTMPEGTDAGAESLLRSLCDVIIRTKGSLNLHELSNYRISDCINDIISMENQGVLTPDESADLQADFMAGSIAQNAVRSFVNNLGRQMDNVFGKPTANCCKIKKILNRKGVVSIDLGKGANDLAAELVLNHLKYFQESGRNFALILDELPFGKFGQLADIIRGQLFAISAEDVIARLSGGQNKSDELFYEVMGSVAVAAIFRQNSGASAKKWSDQLGTYHKLKVKTSFSNSRSFMNASDTQGAQVEEGDEPRIRADTINMLPDGIVCIHSADGTLVASISP